MEQILSTGPKTWTRWERGKITQTKAADKFIRAIADDPYLARRLMRDAGVEDPEAEEVFARPKPRAGNPGPGTRTGAGPLTGTDAPSRGAGASGAARSVRTSRPCFGRGALARRVRAIAHP